jgi:predicted transcriptional regulator
MATYTAEREFCGLSLYKKYRSHFEIIASILDAAKDNNEDKYSLMKHTGFNYAQLKKYLEYLNKIGFIEMHAKDYRVAYKATAKGLDFLRQYYVLLGILLNAYTQNKQPQIVCEAKNPPSSRSKNYNTILATRLAK